MRRRTIRQTLAAAAVAMAAMAAAPSAQAAIPSVFVGDNYSATPVNCTPQPSQNNVRLCSGLVKTWDNTVIDVNVILPPDPGVGQPDGNYPAIGTFHGWGGSKIGVNDRTKGWALDGYAVFSMSDRGWGNSCGGADPKRITDAATGCAEGYNHLMDTRYEVRDAQYLFSLLADENVIDGQRIGVTGPSYGGGISMSLAALKNRIMNPDGTYAPWLSPNGSPMRIAAAAPEIPWTDLAYSLQPNGATLDYAADSPYRGPNGDRRIGVMKQSFVAGLYALGAALSNYAPPGADQDADLHTWYARVNAGEPGDGDPLAEDIVDEITTHHSSYYIDHSVEPAPLLINNGWTDDLFPADEAIRFYNRTRTQYPGAHLSLFFRDAGHQRGGSHPGDTAKLQAAQDAWFNHFVKGTGPAPTEGVTALTQTCPNSGPGAAPSVEFTSSNWASLAPGEIRLAGGALQPIAPQGGNPQTNQTFDPIAGPGACAEAAGQDVPGAATYRLGAAPAGGFTILGSPTIIADFFSPGPNNQIAARLLDVDPAGGNPGGDETLIARGLWRPTVNVGTTGTRQVFQLHPNGWRVAPGHVVKLELLPNDQPYGRNSNGQGPITVENLQLRLPVAESPGALSGLVQSPADKVLPPGYALARDFTTPNDTDNDGWPNDSDNCPGTTNADQVDTDGDGTGDACDAVNDDPDGDGVRNDNGDDNCPAVSNPSQTDTDTDGVGDACDPSNDDDVDGDGVDNDQDNCPNASNPGQQDVDGDGTGNACDPQNNNDLDDDGVNDTSDNCPGTANPGQLDDDQDGTGNACDPLNNDDFDDDGVENPSDNCDENPNQGQQNSDGDADGDACDDDDDNDTVLDAGDACRTQPAMTADGCPLVPAAPVTPAAPAGQATQTPTQGTAGRTCKKKRSKRGVKPGKRRRCKRGKRR